LKRPKYRTEEKKEMTLEEFERLLSEKQRDKFLTMHKFLSLAYESMAPVPSIIPDASTCASCELPISQSTQSTFSKPPNVPPESHDQYSKALLLPCKHLIHRYCLEDTFRKKINRCPTCQQIVLPGYQAALLTKRLVNSEVLRQKKKIEGVASGNYGLIGVGEGRNF
jgi:hypothetical protein